VAEFLPPVGLIFFGAVEQRPLYIIRRQVKCDQ
jgi:hypothetical protein